MQNEAYELTTQLEKHEQQVLISLMRGTVGTNAPERYYDLYAHKVIKTKPNKSGTTMFLTPFGKQVALWNYLLLKINRLKQQ